MGMVNLQLNNNLLVSFLNMEEQKTNALNKLVAKLMQTVNNKLQIYCAKLPLRILVTWTIEFCPLYWTIDCLRFRSFTSNVSIIDSILLS